MSTVKKLAEKAVDHFSNTSDDKEAALDPAVLSGFFEIIMQLILKLQECKKTAGAAHEVVQNPTLLQRAVLGLQVRHFLGSGRAFRQHGDAMKAALLKTGEETSKEDFTAAWNEV